METKTKKIRIENTSDFVFEQIKVFKNDFEIYKHELSSEPYYSISLKNGHGGNNVFGGDSAWEDCYNKHLVQSIFNDWDGTLYYTGTKYGYSLNP
jgi:hypothetical protein